MASFSFNSLPSKTFIGIDLTTFTSSLTFHGIANIPPGLHFIYSGTDASLSIRHGRWLLVTSPETYTFQWNNALEQLDLHYGDGLSADQERLQAQTQTQRKKFSDFHTLVANSTNVNNSTASTSTPHNQSDPWTSLKTHITLPTLRRIIPSLTITSLSSSPQDSDSENIPGLTQSEALTALADHEVLNYLHINLKQTWASEDIGSVRTERARDRSWYLSQLLDDISGAGINSHGSGDTTLAAGANTNGDVNGHASTNVSTSSKNGRAKAAQSLLAELQLAYISMLTLSNYSSLQQWKRILSVLLTCQTALATTEPFFVEVLCVLRAQLERVEDVEGGMFELDDEDGSSWLRMLLYGFWTSCGDVFGWEDGDNSREVEKTMGNRGGGSGLKRVLRELETWLTEKYGWDEFGTSRVGSTRKVMVVDGEWVEDGQGLHEDASEDGDEEYRPVVVEL